MNGLSIRWRLTLWYVTALSVILLTFGATMFAMFRSHLLTRTDSELIEEFGNLTGEIEFARSEDEFRERIQRQYSDRENFSYQVCREDGTVLCGSPWLLAYNMPKAPHISGRKLGEVINFDLPYSGRHRLYQRTVRGPNGLLGVHAITSLARSERELSAFLVMLLVGGSLAFLAAISGGFLIARRAMEPIHRIVATAERISSENLSERIPIANRFDEIGRLAVTLNGTFDRLQSAIDEMRRFTADAAHELRTPLAVIRTEAEVALRGECSLEVFQRVAEVALDQTTRLSILVDQLLTLSRQEAGLQFAKHEDVALKAVILDVVDTLSIAAEQKRVKLIVGLIPNVAVLGEDVALCQLFFNLLDNALKFTPPDGMVTVSGELDGESVKILVADTGIGIESQDLPQIFQRFFRVDSSRTTGGTGLGLAICESIVVAHRGKISVESRFGEGTRFTVTLPYRKLSSAEIDITGTGEFARQPVSLS